MSEAKENCWCCRITLSTPGEIRPHICAECIQGRHASTESDSDMFMVSTDCRDCKLYKALRVKRSGAQKLFENRDLIKCKGCGKTQITLKMVKIYETSSRSYSSSEEEILPAKEWRDKEPAEVAFT